MAEGRPAALLRCEKSGGVTRTAGNLPGSQLQGQMLCNVVDTARALPHS